MNSEPMESNHTNKLEVHVQFLIKSYKGIRARMGQVKQCSEVIDIYPLRPTSFKEIPLNLLHLRLHVADIHLMV